MRIGVGLSYYGKRQSDHADAVDQLIQKTGAKACVITGSAYPEIARADLARQMLMHELDVLVFVDNYVVPDVDQALAMAEEAHREKGVVTVSVGAESLSLAPRPYHFDGRPELAFSAVSRSVFERLAELDDRTYQNSSVIDTGFSRASRPFFSPWRKSPGTLFAECLMPGLYMTPDGAFMHRVTEQGIYRSVSHSFNKFEGAFLKIKPGDAEKRRAHGAPNYAVCVPVFGGWDDEQYIDVLTLHHQAGLSLIELHNMPYLDTARGILVQQARELGCDGVFFLDHDIIFRPGDVVEIMNEARELDAVVGAVYNMRKTAHALIGAVDVPLGEEVGYFKAGKVYPALYTGMGFTAIPMSVFKALDGSFPLLTAAYLKDGPYHARALFSLDVNGTFYSGEDVSFCARVHGLSVKRIDGDGSPNGDDWELTRTKALTDKKIFLDTRVRIFHKGSYCYGVEDHSINVPRYENLFAKHVGTRKEMREFIIAADTLSPEARIRAQGLDEESDNPHGTLGRGNERDEYGKLVTP